MDFGNTKNASVEELREYYDFVRNSLHVLVYDHDAIFQMALNLPDSSVIYKQAGTYHFMHKRVFSKHIFQVEIVKHKYPNRMFKKWINKSKFNDPCTMTIIIPMGNVTELYASDDGVKVAALGMDDNNEENVFQIS